MDQRGIAPLVIVAIVVAVVAGVGIYVATRGGGVPGGLSLYPESQSWEIPSDMRENVPVGVDYAGYTVSGASVQDVLNWYKGQMTGWTLENEMTSNGARGVLLYKKGNDAAVIVAMSGTGLPGTCYILATGPWSAFGELVGGGGENQPSGMGVSVSISPTERSDSNGATLTYTVTVTNTGNVSDNYSLAVSDNASPSWSPSVSPTSLVVAAGSNGNATLSVTISSTAISGTVDNITLIATSTENSAVKDNASCIAQVITAIVRGVDVSISPAENSAENGMTVTFVVCVRNTGNVAENYDLDNTDDAGWTLTLPSTVVDVAPDENRQVTLTVGILATAENDTRDNITITATSSENTEVENSDTCVAHCTSPKMQTGVESGIPGVYVAKSDLERETSPNVPSGDLAALVQGNSAFAYDLYQKIRSDSGNLFFSPYSISAALAMTYAGARSETEQQMAETLHFTLPQERLHSAFNALDLALASEENENFRLDIANALWGQVGQYFRSDFLDLLATNYGAGMWLVNFIEDAERARIEINDWVSEHTENKIENLLPPGAVDSLTRLVLTNAIYFHASWMFPFSESATKENTFTLLDSSKVTTQMMSEVEELRYAEGEGYQAVELPYENRDTSMLIILPTLNNFNEFETTLDAERVSEIVGNLEYGNVHLKMPKFEFEKSLGLGQILQEMGMSAAFDYLRADFSGIDDSRDLYITNVLHKAFISVNENGTEAAAATAVIIGTISLPPPPIEISIDHPFIFMIRNNSTGAILFLGRVLNPTA